MRDGVVGGQATRQVPLGRSPSIAHGQRRDNDPMGPVRTGPDGSGAVGPSQPYGDERVPREDDRVKDVIPLAATMPVSSRFREGLT